MKSIHYKILWLIPLACLLTSCFGELDKFPKSQMSDASFWKTEANLREACNYLYLRLPGKNDMHTFNNYSDESYGTGINAISDGSRVVAPGTDSFWDNSYASIRSANNIMEKSHIVQIAQETKNKYLGEVYFFRAYFYFELVKRYGDVPLLLRTVDIGDPDVYPSRAPRATVIKSIYADLDSAISSLPLPKDLSATEYGRVTKTAAWSLKARVALFEGTRQKFFDYGDYKQQLQIAVNASKAVIDSEQHDLFKSGNYYDLFVYEGEGRANRENIFVRLYGEDITNNIASNTFSYGTGGAASSPTRKLVDAYLYIDGLPIEKTKYATNQDSTLAEFINRDPRAELTICNKKYLYGGKNWIPANDAFIYSKTGYKIRKAAKPIEVSEGLPSFIDYQLIRYAEVLLTFAEAKYELENGISDSDLELTINALRKRAGFTDGFLSNAFAIANGLNMRTEIRRERQVELAMEGFRYWDLLRWKTAETELPKDMTGTKYFPKEHQLTEATLKLMEFTSEGNVVVQKNRKFNPERDYLWPLPSVQLVLNKNLVQNSKWEN